MKLKNICASIFTAFFIFSYVSISWAGIGIKINNRLVQSDVEPQIIEGRTMVPVRAIFEGVGAAVEWNAEDKTITGTKGNTTIVMVIGEKSMTVNGENINMDGAAMIIDARTYAPARYVAEAFDYDVSWNGELKEVIIKSKPASKVTTEAVTETASVKTAEASTETTTTETTTTEKSTETTTMSAADILNSSPVEGVGAELYKTIKNDFNSAFKIYYIGNANNNRFQRATYNKLFEVWLYNAKTKDEELFVSYSKTAYVNMVTTCSRIDQRKAKYPTNANVAEYCVKRKDSLEELIKKYFSSKNLDEAKKNSEAIKKFASATPVK